LYDYKKQSGKATFVNILLNILLTYIVCFCRFETYMKVFKQDLILNFLALKN